MYIPDWNPLNIVIALSSVLVSVSLVVGEFSPKTRLNYSKFTVTTSSKRLIEITIPSIYGMLVIYVPSLIISTGFLLKSFENNRMLLVSLLIFLHYLKRVMEVLFVHRYSGQSKLAHNCLISTGYAGYAVLFYNFSAQVPQTNMTMSVLGVALFFIGEYTNFYHHLILRDLRKGGSKEYKIPSGGLFQFVWCPHYIGEIISFISMVLVAQHFLVLVLQVESAGYLAARAYNTREWYKQKFPKAPNRACLVPFVY